MNYRPEHFYVGDTWYLPVEDREVHLFHIQSPDHGKWYEPPTGHAVSRDLIHWETLAPILDPAAAGTAKEDGQCWTGCAVRHNQLNYIFYTMRGTDYPVDTQAIGLSISPDLKSFPRYPGNPVISPDPRWYSNPARPISNHVDCRDIMIIPDPAGNGWIGYFTTRIPSDNQGEASVVAAARSRDLIHWEQLPPVFAPHQAVVEVPDVFEINGRWYMMALSGILYGELSPFSGCDYHHGTLYAVADNPLGPFYEPEDNVLLGNRAWFGPPALRSLRYQGELYCLYTDRETPTRTDNCTPQCGTVTIPKCFRASGDRLELVYSDRIEAAICREIPIDYAALREKAKQEDWGHIWPLIPIPATIDGNGTITLNRKNVFVALKLGIEKIPAYILDADIDLIDARSAGFVIGIADNIHGDFIRLDAEAECVQHLHVPDGDLSETRRHPIRRGQTHHLRVIVRYEHVEIYVDDRLVMTHQRYVQINGGTAIFSDGGRSVFRNLRCRELTVPAPRPVAQP